VSANCWVRMRQQTILGLGMCLGRMYQEGLGDYLYRMFSRAEKLYRSAAEAGHVDAMLALADMFARGTGCAGQFCRGAHLV
jgi:TPR repeat protein